MNLLKVITLAGLGVLDLAAGAYALNAWTREPDAASLVPRASAPLAPPSAPDLATLAPGSDAETLGRPLFVKSRRPSPNGPQAAAGAAPPPTGIKLRAVVTLGGSPRAYLVVDGAAEGRWMRLGDEIESWTLDRIAPREIALRRDSQTVSIGFDYTEAPEAPRAALASSLAAPPPASNPVADAVPPTKSAPMQAGAPQSFEEIRKRRAGR